MAAALAAAATASLYRDVDDEEVARLLGSMSLREKAEQTCSYGNMDLKHPDSFYTLKDNERLRIQGLITRDGPRGITCWSMIDRDNGGGPFAAPCPPDGTTPAFPAASLRGATWDVELEREFGRVTGQIAKAVGVHAALLPSVNIVTWLQGGRGQEMYGEDPVHVGKMGSAAIQGVQGEGVMACAKHFAANNVENTRFWESAEIDERTFHEVYMRAWAIAVAEAAPELVMTAYNRVNGNFPFAAPSRLLEEVLRGQYGFEGTVITDWLATQNFLIDGSTMGEFGKNSPYYGNRSVFPDETAALKAGVDMELPFCQLTKITAARLSRQDQWQLNYTDAEWEQANRLLDRAVSRVLTSKLRYGMVGALRPPLTQAAWGPEEHQELALRIARRGIVLLRNQDNFLPRRPSAVHSAVVLGSPDQLELGDHGSSWTHPSQKVVTVLDGLLAQYSVSKVRHIPTHFNASVMRLGWDTPEALAAIQHADLVVVDVGTTWDFEGEYIPLGNEGGDRKYLTLHPQDSALIRRAAYFNDNVVVVISSGMNVVVEDFVDSARAILWLGYPGPLGGQALADILAGDVNPSGRMPCATPRHAEDFVPPGIPTNPGITHEVNVKYPTSQQAHGFKWMWGANIEPRYPLGWGLSYTTFEHGEPRIVSKGDRTAVEVAVRNSGSVRGIETVQVYGSCRKCPTPRLPIVLLGFAKVDLRPAEVALVRVPVRMADLAIYNPTKRIWDLEAGTYTIMAGPFASRLALKSVDYVITATSTAMYPYVTQEPGFQLKGFALWATVISSVVIILLVLIGSFCVVQKVCRRMRRRKGLSTASSSEDSGTDSSSFAA